MVDARRAGAKSRDMVDEKKKKNANKTMYLIQLKQGRGGVIAGKLTNSHGRHGAVGVTD